MNTSIHHELLSPLSTNVIIAKALLKKIQHEEEQKMVQLILTSSNLALFHANDLLDYNIIKTGFFSSSYSPESITKTVD